MTGTASGLAQAGAGIVTTTTKSDKKKQLSSVHVSAWFDCCMSCARLKMAMATNDVRIQRKAPTPPRGMCLRGVRLYMKSFSRAVPVACFSMPLRCPSHPAGALFEMLPDRKEYWDYYDVVQNPICLAQIEEQVVSGQCRSLQQFEVSTAGLCYLPADQFAPNRERLCRCLPLFRPVLFICHIEMGDE